MDLATLWDQWASRLLGYMITITRDRARAEDALQNLFVKLASSRPGMRNPEVYLFRAARNEALRLKRREQPLADLDVFAPRPADPEVLAALEQLPREQAEVVVLHVFEDLAFREIGEILGIPQDTAASRYRYAIEKLQCILKRD